MGSLIVDLTCVFGLIVSLLFVWILGCCDCLLINLVVCFIFVAFACWVTLVKLLILIVGLPSWGDFELV